MPHSVDLARSVKFFHRARHLNTFMSMLKDGNSQAVFPLRGLVF